jgi:hypothetical protein
MAYSQRLVAQDPRLFPPPQRWLVWQQAIRWEREQRVVHQEGQLRHFESLQKAKKHVSPSSFLASRFYSDWAIYHWDDERGGWVEQYAGTGGQHKKDNRLFQTRVRNDQPATPLVADEDVEAAIASILKVTGV